jgi:hypothetical protein
VNIKGGLFVGQLRDYHILKKDSIPSNYSKFLMF